ncbi:MAG: hypothetical protein EHM33_04995 [Chloroflexi bacterium]|nr:MAG: hypothetical protein EHM33_04995 [Chloroflexota bacterium]
MEFNWSIVGWIAGLIFVYLFGIFEGRGQGYKKRKAEEQAEKKDQPPPQPKTVTVDDPGLLRLKNENGSFTLDLDGARVNPTSLLPEQRKRLVEILSIMRPWLEGRSAPAPSVTMSPAHPPTLSNQPPPTPAPVQPAPPPLPASPQTSAPKPGTIAKEDRPSAPAGSIVTQIDSILQARLAGTPLEERGVFLTESAQGGVNVYVGLTRYSGVDEVPDPEVKAAIRAAITEWENKYTPGL